MTGRIAAAVALLALAACTVGPRYARPGLDVPDRFRDQTAEDTEQSFADLSWWEVYRDPTLQGLIDAALRQNRDIRFAAARVAEARADLAIARTAPLPQIDLTANAQRGRVFQSGSYLSGTLYSVEAQASFELDLWRRLAGLADAARAQLLATEYARDGVLASLVGDVATAYFSLVAADQALRVTGQTVASRQRFLDLTQSMFERGAASAVDVSRAQASLDGARASEADLSRQIAQLENELRILLGENPGPIERPAADLEALPRLPDIPPGLPSRLLERRPDLRVAEAGLQGATADVRAAKAALYPTISLTGAFGWESAELSDLFSGASRIWALGIDLIQPLIDSQRNRHQVEAARALTEQALLQYQSAVAQAFREVADALAAKQRYDEALAALERQAEALKEARARVLRRYEVGYSSYFEVIDAETSLYTAQLSLIQTRRDALVNVVQLYKALGGGWENTQAAQTTAGGH